ncbi:MAG: hypothetical protein ACTSPT_02565 [Candidatus Heimdallarchaeota archaeon]
MASNIQWEFVTDKYSLVDCTDNLIVIARFNQSDLLRDFIGFRSKMLNTKTYDDITFLLDELVALQDEVTDKRLEEELKLLIDQLANIKHGKIEIKDKIKAETETGVSE